MKAGKTDLFLGIDGSGMQCHARLADVAAANPTLGIGRRNRAGTPRGATVRASR